MKLDQLNHIGVAVKDLEKAKEFLRKNFEAEVIHEIVSEAQGIQFATLSLGELKLELMASVGEQGMISEFIRQRGEGIHHLSFQVQDLRSEASFFEKQGLKTIRVPSEIPGIEAVFLHPKSFLGILVELFQKTDEGYQKR